MNEGSKGRGVEIDEEREGKERGVKIDEGMKRRKKGK